jgi:hypothetical protein
VKCGKVRLNLMKHKFFYRAYFGTYDYGYAFDVKPMHDLLTISGEITQRFRVLSMCLGLTFKPWMDYE